MSKKIKKIDSHWRMESVSNPSFKYEEAGLEVSFMIFISDNERQKDIKNYMMNKNISNEKNIPDIIYNNAGYAIIYFNFNSFDNLTCMSINEFLKRIDETDDIIPGVYETTDIDEKVNGYVFIGHDISLSVCTKKKPSEHIKKMS